MDRKSVIVLVFCGILFATWVVVTPKLYPPPALPTRGDSVAETTTVTTGDAA